MVEATAQLPIVQTENPPNFQKEDSMNDYVKITALYERLSIGDERQRQSGEDSNSMQNHIDELTPRQKTRSYDQGLG